MVDLFREFLCGLIDEFIHRYSVDVYGTGFGLVSTQHSISFRVVERQTFCRGTCSWYSLLYVFLVCLEVHSGPDRFSLDRAFSRIFSRFNSFPNFDMDPLGRVDVYSEDYGLFQSCCVNNIDSIVLVIFNGQFNQIFFETGCNFFV